MYEYDAIIYARQRLCDAGDIIRLLCGVTFIEAALIVKQPFIAENCLRVIVLSVNMDVIIRLVLIYGE